MSLATVATERVDGPWEMLATAAGNPVAIERSKSGISHVELSKGAFGAAVAPSVVMARVEALVAHDRRVLEALTADWLRPQHIGGSPWWMMAWRASLRHLKALHAIERAQVDVAELRDEVEAVWGGCPMPFEGLNWRQVVRAIAHPPLRYHDLRRVARCHMLSAPITAEDLVEGAPTMLRLLRGRHDQLDAEARALIAGWGERALGDAQFLEGETTALEHIVEVPISELDPLRTQVEQRLASALKRIDAPTVVTALTPLCLILLGDWRLP